MRALALPLFLAVTFSALGANAHILLDEPPTRDVEMKAAPCGGTLPRTTDANKIRTYRPGERITVRWHETVVHAGFFRVAFSTDSTTFPPDPTPPVPATFAFPILAFVPKVNGTTEYSAEVTLPSMECASCSLQVIQYMNGRAAPYYYQCGDIVLSNGAPIAPAGGAGSGGAPNGGTSNGGTSNGGTTTGGAPPTGSGGTSTGTGGTTSGGVSPIPGPSGGAAASAGSPNTGGASPAGSGGAPGSAGTPGTSGAQGEPGDDEGGCALTGGPARGGSMVAALGVLAAWLGRRRRQSRSTTRA